MQCDFRAQRGSLLTPIKSKQLMKAKAETIVPLFCPCFFVHPIGITSKQTISLLPDFASIPSRLSYTMSQRSASSHPASILRSRRLRFDTNAPAAERPASGAANPTSKSPSAVAKALFDSTVETLPQDVQAIATRFGHNAISAYVAWKTKQAKLDQMASDGDFIPKPLRCEIRRDFDNSRINLPWI